MFWINSAGVDYSHNMPQHKMVICLPKPHPSFERIVYVVQGGMFEALHENGYEPDWND